MLLRTVTVTPLAVSETGRSDDHTQNCRKSKRSHLRSTATLAPLWLPVKPTMNADVLLLALGVRLKLNMTHSEELTEIFLLSRIRASVLSRLSPLVPGTVVVVVLSRLYMVADIYIVDSVHAAMHGDSALSGIHSEILHGSRLAGATLTSQLQQGSLRNPKLPLRSTSKHLGRHRAHQVHIEPSLELLGDRGHSGLGGSLFVCSPPTLGASHAAISLQPGKTARENSVANK